jgi:NADPH:quinone reductase-like Zn-dependent oxidoreductase
MRVYALPEAGSTPQLIDVPDPKPGPGELLVRVAASSVNGFDAAVAAGMLQGMMEHRYPVVLGKDFAGIVEAVGDQADRFAVGDRAFGVVMKPYLADGGLGELLVVGEQFGIAPVPSDLDLTTAGALGLAGTAAVDAVEAISVKPGETVLIVGATGGVGSIATQYVVAAGGTVIATARPGPDADLLRQLGATHTVDYTADLGPQVLALAPGGVDAVIHLAGDGLAFATLLAAGGRLASTLGLGPEQHPAAIAVMASPGPATLERLSTDVAAGRIRVPITATYDFADVADAFAAYATGALGKLAVTIS